MTRLYRVGETISLKAGAHHDLLIESVKLPAPPLKKGDKGDRVKQLQQALARIHDLPAAHVTGTFDAATENAVGKLQRHWALRAPHGTYDAAARDALEKQLAGEQPKTKPHPAPPQSGSVREKIVANARWGIHNEPRIHYAEVRPIPALNEPHRLPLTTDCSGFATLCYKWAGAPDPNGNGWSGEGYTGTLLSHMKHISPGQVEPGDLVVFGGGGGHHVAIALNRGGSLLASHGSERGPMEISFADEHAYQSSAGAGQVTWLTVPA